MATCKIHLTEMLVTHGKMQHTSDKYVKYTWKLTYKMLDTHENM